MPTSYVVGWENGRYWLKHVNGDAHKAYCKLCKCSFRIDGGVGQLKHHETTKNMNSFFKEASANNKLVGQNGQLTKDCPSIF